MTGFDRMTRQLVAAVRGQLAGDRRARPPEAGETLWAIYGELAAARVYDPTGPCPIGWEELRAWSQLHRWPLEPRHVPALRAMDLAWLAGVAARRAPAEGVKAAPHVSSAPISPDLFDATFR